MIISAKHTFDHATNPKSFLKDSLYMYYVHNTKNIY